MQANFIPISYFFSHQVGLACVLIAKAKGLSVYGTAGSQEGIELVLKHGATACFNHREDGYMDKIVVCSKIIPSMSFGLMINTMCCVFWPKDIVPNVHLHIYYMELVISFKIRSLSVEPFKGRL